MIKRILRIGLPLLVLAAGGGVAIALIKTKPEAKRVRPTDVAPTVELLEAKTGQEQVRIEAMGTVVAAEQIVVHPEVSGRIVHLSDKLIPGGRFEKDEVLLRIDAKDYRLALEQQRSALEKAKFEHRVESNRQRIAEREWTLLNPSEGVQEEGKELALRKPHIENAQAAMKAAESSVERARLNISRTVLRAPFNAFVKEELVDKGQLVTPQSSLLTLVGTDKFWVQVSVPVERLAMISVPGVNGDVGSAANIVHRAGTVSVERTGRVLRLMGALDARGKMAQLLVEVDDPMGAEAGGLPLLLGAYVEVSIEGNVLEQVMSIPRIALHEGNEVYTLDAENRLRIKRVTVAFRRADNVLVSGGLEPGDRVITSRVPTPVDGALLRPRNAAVQSTKEKVRAEADVPSGSSE